MVPRELLDHFIGRVGYTHNQPADVLLRQADVVVCVGYDLIEYDPTEWLGPQTTLIHVDEIPATVDARTGLPSSSSAISAARLTL